MIPRTLYHFWCREVEIRHGGSQIKYPNGPQTIKYFGNGFQQKQVLSNSRERYVQ